MNWEAIGAIAEVIGVIAVVVSLIFVGVQIRQNTTQQLQDNFLSTIRGTLDVNWYYHRDEAAFDIYKEGCANFDAMAPKDQAHFHSILVDLLFYYNSVLGMHRAGLIDTSTLEISERYVLAFLVTDGGKQWWSFARRSRPIPDATIAHLQSRIDDPGLEVEPITELQPWFSNKNQADSR